MPLDVDSWGCLKSIPTQKGDEDDISSRENSKWHKRRHHGSYACGKERN